ncbi:Putative L-lactate dehydrogenase operon regulatory protein [Fundidesulfovibrio magnetotacticus]|uniref:L-lactate dehydrogenase operon regulatory protein n=1 Tax=Fundidesulfovibrio magnetotacticus TaxID=2730080 RepID=A0A6V8M5L1_9BACT|nr:FadR/GntR family transcriptional regulator [Fundidesulfovibrio magnetotacticus]GFK95855.1 Putative L-lactate dehydrogenase operon regulatory protein [Fundidesulfovibrio magnetotacticus]
MVLQPVESQRLYQQVASQVAEALAGREWQPGQRLPSERDLALRFGVSRPTIREAIIALELQGLVEVRTGSGIFVKDLPAEPGQAVRASMDQGPSPFDLISARIVIEGELAAIAARDITSEEIEGLAEAIGKMEADIETGTQEVLSHEDGDLLFHARIAAVSRNSVLRAIVQDLWEGMRHPLFQAICRKVKLPTNARRAAKDHRVILDRIAVGDAEGARAAMRRHLEQVRRVLLGE